MKEWVETVKQAGWLLHFSLLVSACVSARVSVGLHRHALDNMDYSEWGLFWKHRDSALASLGRYDWLMNMAQTQSGSLNKELADKFSSLFEDKARMPADVYSEMGLVRTEDYFAFIRKFYPEGVKSHVELYAPELKFPGSNDFYKYYSYGDFGRDYYLHLPIKKVISNHMSGGSSMIYLEFIFHFDEKSGAWAISDVKTLNQ